MPAPQQANVVASGGTVFWSDGVTAFDGWAVFVLALPSGYTTVTNADQDPPQQLAQRFKCNLLNGKPDTALRVNFTTSLNPPGCKYAVYWYDGEDQLVYQPASPSELFSVTSSPVYLPSVLLVKPTAANTLPAFPGNGPVSGSATVSNNSGPQQYSTVGSSLSGSVNGSNCTFTLPLTPNQVVAYRNGVFMTQGSSGDYTVSGAAVVLTTSQTPQFGDVVTVLAW